MGAEQEYRRVHYGLLGSGYVPYTNSNDLAMAFIESRPDDDLEQVLLGDVYRQRVPQQENPALVYVKPPINSEAVITTSEVLNSSMFGAGIIVDDPIENPSPTLDWYAGTLSTADAVLCQLLGTHQKGHSDHNVKCSLVAGLSRGLQKHVLMLAEKPFDTPIDYQALLQLHDTAHECGNHVEKWGKRSYRENTGSPKPSIRSQRRSRSQSASYR